MLKKNLITHSTSNKKEGDIMTELMQAVSTCGFPIVMCFCLLYYIISRSDKTTTALEQNTLALQSIQLLLQQKEDDEL